MYHIAGSRTTVLAEYCIRANTMVNSEALLTTAREGVRGGRGAEGEKREDQGTELRLHDV